jgi:hypothetical protein
MGATLRRANDDESLAGHLIQKAFHCLHLLRLFFQFFGRHVPELIATGSQEHRSNPVGRNQKLNVQRQCVKLDNCVLMVPLA